MSRRVLWREGEVRVISVTPVSRGVIRPFLLTVTTLALDCRGGVALLLGHRAEDWLVVVLVLAVRAVTLTRTWRWRSHKVHVTNERMIIEGGVLRHYRTSIELRDVLGTRVDQRVSERFTRRGFVTSRRGGLSFPLGHVVIPVRSAASSTPSASAATSSTFPLDTIYTYEDPEPYQFEMQPDQWQRRRYE